jgi:hypothetical protein
MQNDKKNLNTRSHRVPSVEETTAAIKAEQEREEAAQLLPQGDESAAFESSNQSSSSENMERAWVGNGFELSSRAEDFPGSSERYRLFLGNQAARAEHRLRLDHCVLIVCLDPLTDR